MSVAFERISSALKDIQARRYRSIIRTHDGTVIIVDAETGKTASGRDLKEAENNFGRSP